MPHLIGQFFLPHPPSANLWLIFVGGNYSRATASHSAIYNLNPRTQNRAIIGTTPLPKMDSLSEAPDLLPNQALPLL